MIWSVCKSILCFRISVLRIFREKNQKVEILRQKHKEKIEFVTRESKNRMCKFYIFSSLFRVYLSSKHKKLKLLLPAFIYI